MRCLVSSETLVLLLEPLRTTDTVNGLTLASAATSRSVAFFVPPFAFIIVAPSETKRLVSADQRFGHVKPLLGKCKGEKWRAALILVILLCIVASDICVVAVASANHEARPDT